MTVLVAYPGPDGTNTADASERLFPDADLLPLPSFSAVAEATAQGAVDFGVLPIESSLVGPVAETHDILWDSPLSIWDETVLPIRHCLVGVEDVALEAITIVRSHPTALDQCRRLLAGMPWATSIAAGTTADAAKQIADHGDPSEAAIASERAAELYDLRVIAGNVGDHPDAYTRFVSLATSTRLDRGEGTWRTAFAFITDHQPGALHRAIEPFGRHEINLRQLVSRPLPETPWRSRFDAVLDGHPLDPMIHDALAELRGLTRRLVVFGSYPAVSS